MTSISVPTSFTIAPFAVDGVLEGQGTWSIADLSPKWIVLCSDILDAGGAALDHTLAGPLSKLRIKCTLAKGAALITILVLGRPASSAAFASGKSIEADADILSMFAASMANVCMGFYASSDRPFGVIETLSDRPLLAVVPHSDALITDQEHDLARELMLHFAAALLLRL